MKKAILKILNRNSTSIGDVVVIPQALFERISEEVAEASNVNETQTLPEGEMKEFVIAVIKLSESVHQKRKKYLPKMTREELETLADDLWRKFKYEIDVPQKG